MENLLIDIIITLLDKNGIYEESSIGETEIPEKVRHILQSKGFNQSFINDLFNT